MAKFKTIEEAQEAYDKLVVESKKQLSDAVAKVTAEKDAQITSLQTELQQVKDVAQDAIDKVNAGVLSNDTFVTVEKNKYKILFGVDGKTKDEVAADKKLVAHLVKIQSGALELVKG